MDGNKRDFIKDCAASNPTGKHEYFRSNDNVGEECKYCGLLRSTVEALTIPVVSPLSDEMINQAKKGSNSLVTNEVFEQILKQTNSKSAIIITFDAPLIGNVVAIKGFSVSSVNIKVPDIRNIFTFVVEALSGKFGGVFNNNQEKNEKGE